MAMAASILVLKRHVLQQYTRYGDVRMGKESKLTKAIKEVVEQNGEGRTDWIGAMANDDSLSLWSLPILGDLLEFFRPYFILLVSHDRIVINKMSFRDDIQASQGISRDELKSFVFKKGKLSSKVRMTLADGKAYKFSFMPAKLLFGHADDQVKALEILEGFQK